MTNDRPPSATFRPATPNQLQVLNTRFSPLASLIPFISKATQTREKPRGLHFVSTVSQRWYIQRKGAAGYVSLSLALSDFFQPYFYEAWWFRLFTHVLGANLFSLEITVEWVVWGLFSTSKACLVTYLSWTSESRRRDIVFLRVASTL